METLIDAVRSFLQLGGPVVAILAALSVVALALILLKFLQFWRCEVGRPVHADRAVRRWREGRPREALAQVRGAGSASARSVAIALELTGQCGLSRQSVEEEVRADATRMLHEFQSGLKLLDAIAQTAPLLGLFGTVLGMIEAFRQLQAAGASVDPSMLAGGIWVALLTTAVGLAVAMPVSLAVTWFEARLEGERVAIETRTAEILSPLAIRSEPRNMAEPMEDSLHAH